MIRLSLHLSQLSIIATFLHIIIFLTFRLRSRSVRKDLVDLVEVSQWNTSSIMMFSFDTVDNHYAVKTILLGSIVVGWLIG